jgi:hypothetical protein
MDEAKPTKAPAGLGMLRSIISGYSFDFFPFCFLINDEKLLHFATWESKLLHLEIMETGPPAKAITVWGRWRTVAPVPAFKTNRRGGV